MGARTPYTIDDLPDAALGQDGGFDLNKAVQMFCRRVGIIALVMAIALGGTVVFNLLQTPIYQAETTLLVSQSPTTAGTLTAGLTSLLGPMAATGVTTHAALLKHPSLVEQAARELGIPGTREELTDRVHPDGNIATNIIYLRVDSTDPGEAADFANRLADLHIKQSRALAQEQSRQASEFLAQELERVRKQLSGSEESLKDYKLAEGLFDIPTQMASTAEMASQVATLIVGARQAEAAAQQSADYYRRLLRDEKDTYVASSTIARNPVVEQLEKELTDLEIRRAEQMAVHGPEHPELKRIDGQIKEATQALKEAVSEVVQSRVESSNPRYNSYLNSLATAEAETRASAARRSALESVQAQLAEQMMEWPEKELEVGRLQRDLTATSEIYVTLVKQYQQAKINEATGQSAVQIVWPAIVPPKPVKPNWPINLLVGGVIGLLFALLAAVVAEARDRTFRSEEELVAAITLPIIGRAPHHDILDPLAERPVGDWSRTLRTQLRLANRGDAPSVVQITSPEPHPGTSGVAVGLAKALADGGNNTLLIDADLCGENGGNRPYDGWAGETPGPGLAGVFEFNSADILGCTRPTPYARLSLLPAGVSSGNAADLLDSPRAAQVFELLRSHFNAIVVDAPQVVGHPEVLLIADLADCTVLVIDKRRTSRGTSRRSVESLRTTGKPAFAFLVGKTGEAEAL
ncbi:MAG: GumC family protein [Candidatus Zipacnadales bacterium]